MRPSSIPAKTDKPPIPAKRISRSLRVSGRRLDQRSIMVKNRIAKTYAQTTRRVDLLPRDHNSAKLTLDAAHHFGHKFGP
jgi:hypothetical protein